MTLDDILYNVRQLSPNDKLALIEATTLMLRQTLDEYGAGSTAAVAEVAAPYRVERVQNAGKHPMQNEERASSSNSKPMASELVEIDFDDYFCEETQEAFLAEMQKFLHMPNPEPEQMIRYGMFKDQIPVDEEYFTMAEWHPSEEELTGDG